MAKTISQKNFSFRIVSDTSKEKVFAEILYKDDQWAAISQEGKEPMIIFFSPSKEKYWEFSLAESLEVLLQAKKTLLNE